MDSVPIGKVLEQLFVRRGYNRRRRLEEVFVVWEEVVGEPEAGMARPLSIENGVLTLIVPNSTLASEVSFSQERYLRRVNDYFGVPVVREVRVRLQEKSRRSSAREATKQTTRLSSSSGRERIFDPEGISLSAEELAWVEQNVAQVRGVEGQTSLRRVLILHLKRQKWERERHKKCG